MRPGRRSDPADQRANSILFTDAGRRFLIDAYQLKKEIEDEYTALLGAEPMRQLRNSLQDLLDDHGA